jgi:pyrimidine-nucleoside phosphorylase
VERFLNPQELLKNMKSGEPRPASEIEDFVVGVVSGDVTRTQAASWLAAAWGRGLSWDETLALTRSMTHSGEVLAWPDGAQIADKHSTGGVGDKVSLVLAPLWAELGWRVPMISGRGLGHTGGTLDKLETIPGFRTDLSKTELTRILEDVGCFISGQTAEIAPADRILYALRDETGTVDSIPLIVASILSKKIAAGVRRLVLDVKVGSGAFMKTEPEACELAEALVKVARGSGLECTARLTAMDRPLGVAVGNQLEVAEAVACLQGGGPDDLRDVVLGLTDHPDAAATLSSGRAYDRFERMVAAQGGDPSDFTPAPSMDIEVHTVTADGEGVVAEACASSLGLAAFELGAGRGSPTAQVDGEVGLRVRAKPGDVVRAGDPLVDLVHRSGHGLSKAMEWARSAYRIGTEEPEFLPLLGRIW